MSILDVVALTCMVINLIVAIWNRNVHSTLGRLLAVANYIGMIIYAMGLQTMGVGK